MNIVWELVKRNSRLYYRNKTRVFFSFLSIIIIVALYAAFLAQNQVDSIKNIIGDVSGIRWVVDSWIMSGIIAVNTVTIPISMISQIIVDRELNTISDFLTAPVKRYQIVLGYLISCWLVSIVIAIFNLLLAEVYIVISGGNLLNLMEFIQVIGIIIISVISFSSICFFIITFIKTLQALDTISTVIGTLIGFVTGIYIPIGVLGVGVQNVIKSFPVSYSATILRQIFMERPLQEAFNGAPASAVSLYKEIYGVTLAWGDFNYTIEFMVLIIVLTGVIFLSLAILRLNKLKFNK